jgi:OOP family OmpA-OmpF porin
MSTPAADASAPTADSSAATTDSSAPAPDASAPATDSSTAAPDASAPATDSSTAATDSSAPAPDTSSAPATDSSTAAPAEESSAAPTDSSTAAAADTSAASTDTSAAAAPAENASHESSYLAGMGTYTIVTKKRRGPNIKHGSGGQFLYGYQFANQFGIEVGGFFDNFETGNSGGTDFYHQGVGLDLTYAFGDRSSFTPFLLIGAGGDRNDVFPDNKDGYSWYANGGAGFVTGPLSESFPAQIRAEARYVYDGWNDHPRDIRIGLGLEIPLTATHNTPPPAPQPVTVVKVVQQDTGLKDSDGDGVVDSADKCPDTPPHTRVDGDGCPLGKVISLKGLHFEFNKTRIMPDGETILNWAAGLLKKYPDMNVEVAGYTDSVGSVKYNEKLSQGRAQAVKDYLVKAGIPDSQMTVKGYGKANPIASNDTADGRELNRRVELRILN